MYGGLNKTLFNKIEKAFNSCIRFAFGIPRSQGTSGHSSLLLGCSLKTYFDVEMCCVIFKLVREGTPKYLAIRLVNSISQRTLKLNVYKRRHKKYNGMLFTRGIKLWNSLPTDARKIRDLKKFRPICIHYLSTNQLT